MNPDSNTTEWIGSALRAYQHHALSADAQIANSGILKASPHKKQVGTKGFAKTVLQITSRARGKADSSQVRSICNREQDV
jgi:hypothetical protein